MNTDRFDPMQKNVMVTGPPGCGKTTLMEKIARHYRNRACGFFTREIRESGRRVGFEIETLDGRNDTLAHVRFSGPYRVGKYGVNTEAIDRVAVKSITTPAPQHIVVIDEIGKMEWLSKAFQKAVIDALDRKNDVIASIAQKGKEFQRLKQRPDVSVIEMTYANRDRLADAIIDSFGQTNA